MNCGYMWVRHTWSKFRLSNIKQICTSNRIWHIQGHCTPDYLWLPFSQRQRHRNRANLARTAVVTNGVHCKFQLDRFFWTHPQNCKAMLRGIQCNTALVYCFVRSCRKVTVCFGFSWKLWRRALWNCDSIIKWVHKNYFSGVRYDAICGWMTALCETDDSHVRHVYKNAGRLKKKQSCHGCQQPGYPSGGASVTRRSRILL